MKELSSYQENRFLYFTWQMFLSYEDISSHGIDTVRLRAERSVFLVSARPALLKGAYQEKKKYKNRENSKTRKQLRISAFSFSQGLKCLCELI